jgi:hypothetical protein
MYLQIFDVHDVEQSRGVAMISNLHQSSGQAFEWKVGVDARTSLPEITFHSPTYPSRALTICIAIFPDFAFLFDCSPTQTCSSQ